MIVWIFACSFCFQFIASSKPGTSESVDNLIRELKVTEASRELDAGLKASPDDFELVERNARILILLGDQEPDKRRQLEFYERAHAEAERAIQISPKESIGYLRRASANGKLALFKGVLQSRELVLQTRADCEKAIEVSGKDPYPLALAHYILGKVHHKLSETPKVLRLPLGLHWGNLKDAEEHYQKSVQLFPRGISFRVDYGQLLMETKRFEEAQEQLEEAKKIKVADPGDPEKLKQAELLLNQIKTLLAK